MQPRQTDTKNQPNAFTIPNNVIAAGISATPLYPFRVFQSMAADHANFRSLGKEAFPKLLKLQGLDVHIFRCAGVLALQSTAKNYAQEKLAHNKTYALLGGLSAAAVTGAAWSSVVETWFNRKVAKPLNPDANYKFTALRFTGPLALNYLIRETAYSVPVFFKADMTTPMWVASTFVSAVITSINTKIIYSESIYDLVDSQKKNPQEKVLPNYMRDNMGKILPNGVKQTFFGSVKQTLQDVAKGGVYTHKAYQPYKNTVNNKQLLANLLLIYCSYPVFLCRITYLTVSALVWDASNAAAPRVNDRLNLFARKNNLIQEENSITHNNRLIK